MHIPLEISFHGLSRSDALEELIHRDVNKLERVCDNLISCRIGVEQYQKGRTTANSFRIRIEMRTPPGHSLVVTHITGSKEQADDLPTAISNAFRSAQRRLKQLVAKRNGEKKSHPQQETEALIVKLFPNEGYGFLRSLEGEEIYFHRNSILNDDFDHLTTGTGVIFTPEIGDNGLQATSVRIVNKPGVSSSPESVPEP